MGALIGYNVFFSGLIVKVRNVPSPLSSQNFCMSLNAVSVPATTMLMQPQYFVGPFQIGYWTAPGRFALEGLITSQFSDIPIPMDAQFESPYFFYLNCTTETFDAGVPCTGSISDYVFFFFGGRFTPEHFWLDVGVLLGYLTLARLLTSFSLGKFNYVNT